MTTQSEFRIVILEDEPVSRMVLKQQLQKASPHVVDVVASGQAAVQLAERARVDVLVADILMDGVDGIQAAQRITARQETEVIFLTGSSDPDTLERAHGLEPVAVMTKPTDVAELSNLIEDTLARKGNLPPEELEPDFLLATLYDTAAVGMAVTDEYGRFVKVNRAYCRTYGYGPEELIGEKFTKVLPIEDREVGAKAHDDFIAGRLLELPADWRVELKTGELRDIYVTAGRMFGNDGRPYKVTTVTDVTEWKRREKELAQALREREVLLREVHHRVKNNLNVLSSLLNMQLEKYQSDRRVAEAILVSINRIKTMSRIYERLHESSDRSRIDLAAYLETLARDLLMTITDGQSLDLEADVQSELIDIDTAISIGLITNELITNSIKHGFASEQSGTIGLRGYAAGGDYVVEVWDTGGSMDASFAIEEQNSLGLQLIQALSAQRNGRIELLDPKSAHFRVSVKLPGTDP